MTSYLALDLAADHQSPSIRTSRYAANLIYKPYDKLKLGAEVGYVNTDIHSGGPVGLQRPWAVQSGLDQPASGHSRLQSMPFSRGANAGPKGVKRKRSCRVSVRDLEFLRIWSF